MENVTLRARARDNLIRYRALLRITLDPGARHALEELIAEARADLDDDSADQLPWTPRAKAVR